MLQADYGDGLVDQPAHGLAAVLAGAAGDQRVRRDGGILREPEGHQYLLALGFATDSGCGRSRWRRALPVLRVELVNAVVVAAFQSQLYMVLMQRGYQ